MEARTGIFVGYNKGFIVTKPEVNLRKIRPQTRKGKLGKRVKLVREVIREVAGYTPLEKKMRELIKAGVAAKEKKAVKLARRRLGTHRRATKKRDELVNLINIEKRRKGEQ